MSIKIKKNNYELRGYVSTNRSKHNLKAHIILVCKYRKKLLKDDLNNFIKAKIYEISESGEFIIVAMESDIDHIHLMINATPSCQISGIIHNLKQISTFYAWKNHNNYLTNFYWSGKHNLWTRGYFCTSIGCVSETTLKHYIENQG